ncbi:MAG: GIY-YIG nuclease family protein [Limisphaerales bacterium]
MVSSVAPREGGPAGNQSASLWIAMFYTYILESLKDPSRRYRGHTANLKQRLADHNAGKCAHTANFAPWKIKAYVALENLEQAQQFERYLKSGSGHAFANKHLTTTSDTRA